MYITGKLYFFFLNKISKKKENETTQIKKSKNYCFLIVYHSHIEDNDQSMQHMTENFIK